MVAAGACPPSPPYMPKFSELEKMVIREEQSKFDDAIRDAMERLQDALYEWTPQDRQREIQARLVRDIHYAIRDFMLTNEEHRGTDRAPIALEYIIQKFGGEVLASLKKTAGRK